MEYRLCPRRHDAGLRLARERRDRANPNVAFYLHRRHLRHLPDRRVADPRDQGRFPLISSEPEGHSVSAVAIGPLAKTPYLTSSTGAADQHHRRQRRRRRGGRMIDRRERPSSIVRPEPNFSSKKQKTLPDVQRLDLAYVSCAAGPARPDGELKWNRRGRQQAAPAGRADRPRVNG